MQEGLKDAKDERREAEEITIHAEEAVMDAVKRRDWAELRRQSLQPGGFGKARRDVWYVNCLCLLS